MCTMDRAKGLMKDIPALKVVRMWAAATQTHPGTKKPCGSMGCPNMAVSRFLTSELLAILIHQAIVILGGSTSIHLLIIFKIRAPLDGDISPLDEFCGMGLVPLRDGKLSVKERGHRIQILVSYPQRGITNFTPKVGLGLVDVLSSEERSAAAPMRIDVPRQAPCTTFCKDAHLAMAGRSALRACRILTFSACTSINFSFWSRMPLAF